LGPLGGGEHPVEEALAEPLERLLDPRDVAQVGTDPDDHRAPSIAARIRRTLVSRPVKIASPTRKWPMFNSASCGMAAIGATLSKVRPWPAWGSMPFFAASAAASAIRASSAARASPSRWA